METTKRPGQTNTAATERDGLYILASEPSIYLHRERVSAILRDDTCTRSVYRVLFGVMMVAEPGNAVYCSPAELGRQLGMPYGTCLAAWKVLLRRGWLREEFNEHGRLVRYRLSRKIAWRGRPWTAARVDAYEHVCKQLTALANEEDAL